MAALGPMLGIKDEYLPNSWTTAESQAKQVLDPILAPTPEGLKLADILLYMGEFKPIRIDIPTGNSPNYS